jgi:HAD superfamily hydrolase (TIGR01490 family)
MNLALFDFDGTITTRDVFPGFLVHGAARWRICLGWGLLGLPYIGMRLGWVSPKLMRLAAAWVGFVGIDESHVRQRGERYARDVIAHMLRPEAMQRIAWHRAQGDRIVVVSASMDAYLEPFCREHGLELVCNHPRARRGRLTGGLRERDCAGAGKVARLTARYDLRSFPLIYAYGDTEEDRAMLELAQRRWFRWEEVSEGLGQSA